MTSSSLQGGFALIGLSVGILVRAELGRLVPWGYLEYGLAESLSISVGFAYLLVTVAAFLLTGTLREPFGWGTVANFLFVTFLWVDVFGQNLPALTRGVGLQVVIVLLAALGGGFGTAIYVSTGAGAGP